MSGCHGYLPPSPHLARCLLWSLGLGAGFSLSLLLRSCSDPSTLNSKCAALPHWADICVLGYLGSLWCSCLLILQNRKEVIEMKASGGLFRGAALGLQWSGCLGGFSLHQPSSGAHTENLPGVSPALSFLSALFF